jgi:hypothetical protein
LTKIPQLIDISPELREAQARYDQLVEREATVSANVRRLRAQKANGEFSTNDTALVDLVLAGKDIPADTDIDAELKRGMAEWKALEDAKEIQRRRIDQLKKEAEKELCQSLRPAHDKIMTRLCKSLAETHAAYVELFRMKSEFYNNGIGYGGLFNIEPDFLDSPTDRTSYLAEFFRDATKAKFLPSVPVELR